ncbi:hypothetical protein NUU61_008952 [Penicillium alfredii]|uniref:Carrier domain-containing protein n=1 Tax=Penicillium alfredii TaxID=1506179 RepID=A0A9W9JWP9_9EURO|nr:uncharacterized protein NUU61_008952 [Penicillium alfredii]KAJ5084373.1 hypothetical protein NUU61_008952 [Penicillium alfredii]
MEPQGKRLLAAIVDDNARRNPDRRLAVIPRGPELADGFQDLFIKDLARAVNFLCGWIERTVGPTHSQETLAYVGSNDVRYCVFILACQKLGYQAFLPSTRNSDEAHLHLLKATNCNKFFYGEERQGRVLEIQSLSPSMNIFQIPSLHTMLKDESGLRVYPSKSFAEVEDETSVIIHSSGTTGMPKPVYLTNGFFAALDALALLPWPTGRQPTPFFHLAMNDLLLATSPLFHLMGLLAFVFAMFGQYSVLLGPDKPLSVEYLTDLVRLIRPTRAIYPPSVLEDMSHSEEALTCLKELQMVYFGGAPLATETGERVRQYTHLVTVIGSSETGFTPSLIPEDPADWGYFEWNSSVGIDMQHTGEGLYELVILRLPNARDIQSIFHTFPNLNAYRTNDLYTQHPTKPYLWKFYGRQDDVIVLSNGEKFNPVTMETIIEGHPLVSKAVVVGQSRFQAGLLVEPNPKVPEMNPKLLIDEIWPTVQVANQTIAAHGRVMKSKVGLASKTKPFKLTPKGTTQRRAVVRDYEKEIDAIYAAGMEEDLNVSVPETLNQDSITDFTRQIIARVLEKDLSSTQDFYGAGLDSLMTIQVSRVLQKSLQRRRPDLKAGLITPQTVYANPTTEQLAQVIDGILQGKTQAGLPRAEKIQRLVERYTEDLPVNHEGENSHQIRPVSPTTIILTGSTGSLGTYLLHALLSNPSVSKVYCLNRSEANSGQQKSFEEKGLDLDVRDWKTRIEFFQVSFGEPRFGLDEAKYQELLDSVDTIVHNAWKVDFNHAVESFEETHIRGVRHFVDFSLSSRHHAHLHFVSSISTVGAWTPEMGSAIPELPMDSSVVLHQGYGESKHVAECICLEASRRSGVPTTVYRVGQIAGPTTPRGQWNPHEWLPTIIATSKAMGKIPNRLGPMAVDWVPVDTLSSIMIEIVHTRHSAPSKNPWAVFHLTNPERAEWTSLIPAIQKQYPVEPVEFAAWVAELDSIPNPSSAEVAEKPALKLLDFYRGLQDDASALSVTLDVQRAKKASVTMRSLGPVSPTLMVIWLQQWQF